jgi:uroporphyrinogen-III decarboxylase
MTSKERVLTAFDHREPDRVPVWLGASPRFREKAIRQLGLPDDESLSLYVGDDFRRVLSRFAGPQHADPYTHLPPSATYRSPFGILRHGYEGGQPMNHPLKAATTLDDIHNYAWPDPLWMDVSHIRSEALKFGDQYAILGGEWSPFWHDAIDLMGMDTLMFKMYDAPELVDALFDHLVDYYAAISWRIFDEAAEVIDIFFIGNDFGSQVGPLLGDALFRRFLVPPLKRLIDLGHDYGLKVLLHCCGGFAPLIPAMIKAGIDGLQALQPNCRGMDPATLKAAFGDKILLMGAISTQLIIEGSPDTVRAETQRILNIMMPGGGYVACPSHDYVLVETPVENVLALYETVRDCGEYR